MNLQELLQDSLRRALTGTKMSIHFPPVSGWLKTHVDESSLVRVLYTLSLNAREAAGGVGRIHVQVGSDLGHILLGVTDFGPGIRPDHARHVFIPGWTTKVGHRGIGLSSARTALRRQGGDLLYARNSDEGGTTFVAVLPGTLVPAPHHPG